MDLGIKEKKAIVCASSKGLGKGCALSLAREGVNVTICARTEETLEEAADEIRALCGGAVTMVACDITTEDGQKAVLAACPAPDILINNRADLAQDFYTPEQIQPREGLVSVRAVIERGVPGGPTA